MFTLIALVLTLAAFGLLGVLFGADSRDGLDWASRNFELPRRNAPAAFRSADSPAPEGAERDVRSAHRELQAV